MIFDSIVVGAGAAGLTAAAYLAKYGHSVLLCEKEAYCGGLINSFTRDGFSLPNPNRKMTQRIADGLSELAGMIK